MSNGLFSPVTTRERSGNGSAIKAHPNRGVDAPITSGETGNCVPPHKGAGSPPYVLVVKNPPTPAIDNSCLWQDDNGILVQENDNDTICIDNA